MKKVVKTSIKPLKCVNTIYVAKFEPHTDRLDEDLCYHVSVLLICTNLHMMKTECFVCCVLFIIDKQFFDLIF